MRELLNPASQPPAPAKRSTIGRATTSDHPLARAHTLRAVRWPPRPGEMLPRAEEAFGVREKLAGYSLDESHEEGGPKARGFRLALGITIADLDHLEAGILAGIARTPIASVRDNAPYGVNCVVDVAVRGIGPRDRRVASVRTVWELRGPVGRPRLVSAYLKP